MLNNPYHFRYINYSKSTGEEAFFYRAGYSKLLRQFEFNPNCPD